MSKFLALFILFCTATAVAQTPNPLLLKQGEEIVFKGNKWDSVICGPVKYNTHDYTVVVTEVADDCKCDTPKLTRIYQDGLYKGSCKVEYSTQTPDVSGHAFLDFKLLEKLSDKDLLRLLQNSKIGSCRFNSLAVYEPQKGVQAFDSYLALAQDELNLEEKTDAVFLKAAKSFVKDGLCGQIVALTADQLKKTRANLGYLDIGFDLMVAEGYQGEDLAKMRFPVKKIRAQFNLSIEKFVDAGYGASALYAGGFKLKELVDAKFKLSDLGSLGVSVQELAQHFTLSDFVAAKDYYGGRVYSNKVLREALGATASDLKALGAGIADLQLAGYDLQKDLKPLFTLQNFRDVKDYYGSRTYSDKFLREKLGFSASELKAHGSSITDLQAAGFDMAKDVKPLFTLKNFREAKDYYGSRVYSDKYLRETLGYKASELKAEGSGITDLQAAGFDVVKDIKPLFTLKNFRDVKDYYGSRTFSDKFLRETLGYKAPELKAEGAGIADLQAAGFDLLADIKPLFNLKAFRAIKDYYGSRTYSDKFLKERLGYSAAELKAEGSSIADLQSAGFDLAAEIKPLFTLKNFREIKDYYGGRTFSDKFLKETLGYSASELKTEGSTIGDLRTAGFNILTDIKPLFSASDFAAIKDYYGSRQYPASILRTELRYSARELKEAGLPIRELFQGGFTKQQLRDAGFTVEEVDAL